MTVTKLDDGDLQSLLAMLCEIGVYLVFTSSKNIDRCHPVQSVQACTFFLSSKD